MATALDRGAAVVWVDPADPEAWPILHAPESLATLANEDFGADRDAALLALVRTALDPNARRPSRLERGTAGSPP